MKVLDECRRVLGGHWPVADDLDSLPYLRNVVAETLRLYPADTIIERRVAGTYESGSTRLKAGSIVYVVPWVLHRDPRWWGDADAFRPERWTDVSPEARLSYLPWGYGPHVCIGQPLAELEIPLVAAGIAPRYRLSLSSESHEVRPQLVAVNIHPSRPIVMSVQARS
jgi:cytochrome P450